MWKTSFTLRTYLLSDEGKEVTIYRLRKGDVCVLAASCMLSAITFDVEMEAQTDTRILLVPVWLLSKLQEENVYVENFIYKEAAKRFSDVIEALQQMMFLSLTQRIASFLLDESAKQNTSSIFMTHEEIAKIIGSAREAVSRILKQMAKNGYISLNRGEIKIEENTSSIFMTHEEIAKIIGSAREAVSRILKQMAKNGYISLNRGEIKIEEKAKLYQLL